MIKGRTLAKAVSFEGIGLHSGEAGKVTLSPRCQDGIFFLTQHGLASLDSASVEEDNRLTGFRLYEGTIVRTAEHLLGAVVGMGLTGVVITLEGMEVPILDGSAHPFAAGIAEAGFEEYDGSAPRRWLSSPVVVDNPKEERAVMALPSDKFIITYVIDYTGTPVGTQRISYEITPEIFLETISWARTFGFTRELDYLAKSGLAKGGSLDNALIFDDRGLLNKEGLRFPLECVTHKVIDLLGDLAFLSDIPTAHYIAICAGHGMHKLLTNRLRKVMQR